MGKKEDEEAIRKMLDDLGIHRVEELPLADDMGGGAPPRHSNNQGAPPPVTHQPQRPLTGEYASIWQAAMDAGKFQDAEYHGVKNLDNLGDETGRLYANRARGEYGDVPTHPELHSHVARRHHAAGLEMTPRARLNPDHNRYQVSKLGIVLDRDAPITAFNNHKGTTAHSNPRDPPHQQGGAAIEPRPRVQQAGPRPAPVNGSNLRPQQGGSNLTAPAPNTPRQPQSNIQSQGNGPNGAPSNPSVLTPNTHNIVFEAPIQYVARRRGGKETPGKVTLHQPPKKGLFRLFVMDKLYGEYGLGDFQNFTHNREEATITLRFSDPSKNSHAAKENGVKKVLGEGDTDHTLKFRNGDAAFDFLETYNLIWAGVTVKPIPIKKPAQVTNQPSSAIGAANSANTTGRATKSGPASSVARRPAPPATQNGPPSKVTRNGPATPATRNGAPPQVARNGPPPQMAHWGARLAAANDFDPFSVTFGSPRSQAQSAASTIAAPQPSQAHLRPPPGLPPLRVLAPPPGLPHSRAVAPAPDLSAPAYVSRVPPGHSQPQSKHFATQAGGSSQQPNLRQPSEADSKPEPCSPSAATMGHSNSGNIRKDSQIKPESAKSTGIQPEARDPAVGNDISVPEAEDILKALTKIAGITEAGSVQVVAKLLVSLIPGKLDNLLSGSMETSHKEETGEPSQKKETGKSSSGPQERGESSGDSWMVVDAEAAETSESHISKKGRGTRTDSKPSAAKHGADSSTLRRLQYSENEMRTFRSNAVRPPHWLNELRFLPARGENVPRTPAPTPRPMPSMKEQIAKIQASAYEVNLGNKAAFSVKVAPNNPNESDADEFGEAADNTSVNGPNEAAPETRAQEDSGKVEVGNAMIVANPALDKEDNQRAGTPQARAAGLQASVWAAGESRVEHPHVFAGPFPEYPQHSYFNDLLQLVDNPVTNTASSNLGGEATAEAQEAQEKAEAPTIRGLGASRHAGSSTPNGRF